jgi:hypothetical protein
MNLILHGKRHNEKAISWICHRGDGHVMSMDPMWFIVFDGFNGRIKNTQMKYQANRPRA